jgi:hypothetical protein
MRVGRGEVVLVLLALGGAGSRHPEPPSADNTDASPPCPRPALLAPWLRLESERSMGARVATGGTPLGQTAGGADMESRTLVLSIAAECRGKVPHDTAGSMLLAVRVRAELQVLRHWCLPCVQCGAA